MAGSASPALGKAVYGLGELGEGYEHGIETGTTPHEALANATGEALINTALEYGFGNIGGVSKAMNPVKEEIADKAFDVLKLVVKDKSIAKEMGEAAAVAVSSTIGAELEVNAERYLRNIYLGENNEISFTDREVVEDVIISIAIDEAFELADRGEIELKSGNDLQNIEFDTGKGYDGGVVLSGNIKYKPQELMEELAESGVKYNLDEVVSIKKDTNGKLLWLENGNENSGLIHILEGHENNFASRGIYDVVEFLDEILETEPFMTGSNRKGPFSEYSLNGNNYRVVYGTNGYIVSFYPID